MDYIQPVYEFKDKIFHIHFKDIKIRKDKLAECGVMAYPLDFMQPKIPGLGDIDWGLLCRRLRIPGMTYLRVLKWRTGLLRAAGRK